MVSLTVEQARALLWDAFQPGPIVARPLADAMGLVLAENVTTDIDFPPYDRLAMDGYAVRSVDVATASPGSPVRLRVLGVAAAGTPFTGTVGPGETTRAMTGAALPDGADAVIKVEDTGGFRDDEAEIRASARAGQHVAPRGQDLRAGELVLAAGTPLASRHLQALASAGRLEVSVYQPPRAIVFSTGDELVRPDQKPAPGQIRESNNQGVRGVLAEFGIECAEGGVLADVEADTREGLSAALQTYDLVVLSGGVSMGERDLVKPVLGDLGVRLRFENLHLKPGHPATFGTYQLGGRRGAVFALPGNPVAVFVTLQAVFSAGLRRWLGYDRSAPPRAYAKLGFDFRRKGNRPMYLPTILKEPSEVLNEASEAGLPWLEDTGHHGSGDFVSLARADALAWLPDDKSEFARGDTVEILRLDARGSA